MINLIKDYIEKRIELIKLNAAEKTLKVVGVSIPVLILFILMIFFLILLNIGLGLFIGNALHNSAYGFLLLAAFYLFMMILVFLFRNNIKNLFINKAIKTFFNEK